VNAFAQALFPSARPLGERFSATYKFEVPRGEVVLSHVFAEMESQPTRDRLGLVDWSLTETTLEEVFLKLAELAHVAEAISAAPRQAQGWGEAARDAWAKVVGGRA